jgi:hypothetical protein
MDAWWREWPEANLADDGYRKFADSARDVLLAYLDGRDFPRFAGH